jgi:hypothetical protein
MGSNLCKLSWVSAVPDKQCTSLHFAGFLLVVTPISVSMKCCHGQGHWLLALVVCVVRGKRSSARQQLQCLHGSIAQSQSAAKDFSKHRPYLSISAPGHCHTNLYLPANADVYRQLLLLEAQQPHIRL